MLDGLRNRFSSIFSTKAKQQKGGPPYNMAAGIIPGSRPGELPRMGQSQLIEGYNLFPWLRAVVNKIADTAAGVEWNVSGKSKDGTLKPVLNHPLVDLLNNGNEMFSGYTVRHISFVYMLIVGEFFWLKERDSSGTPIALWPLPPSWVIYSPAFAVGPDGKPSKYQLQFRQWRALIPFEDIVHIWEPNPTMPYGRGTGRATVLSDELETDEFAARHVKAFFYNSARPDLLISSIDPDLPLNADDADRLEQRWLEKNGGWKHAHKPMFVSGGPIKVDEIGSTLTDMQFVELRKWLRGTIMQVYGLPPELLGVLEQSNRATIDAAEFFMTKHVVLPKLGFVRNEVQHRLAPEFDKRLVLGFESPVQVDKEQRLEIMKSDPFAFSVN